MMSVDEGFASPLFSKFCCCGKLIGLQSAGRVYVKSASRAGRNPVSPRINGRNGSEFCRISDIIQDNRALPLVVQGYVQGRLTLVRVI